ncbi:CHC2 zinc finger domain-containing protein [Micromonospora krabiensis]|uniref:CHC2 zinc finger domain-containing protein n=1 Tax=Micromonospora krabiensis TaxID=307121 RepID=UPI001E55E41C|nr:CHC2 zinc finger domain-containing protein [Micromonospora krabiensis]
MVWCPIHEEQGSSRSPSCSVRLDEGLWHCHGCGKGGDVWTLLMEKEGVNFERARALAAQLGLSADGAGRGSEPVSGGSYFRRRSVPAAKGNQPRNGGYKPSWRRK